jgi:small subunit ribosomal protein S1
MTTSLPTSKPPAEVHPMQALLDQGGYEIPQRGDIREGTVLSVNPQEVIIDLGLKREGIVPANDLSRLDEETAAAVQEGSVWPVYILQPSDREGNLIVSLSRAIQEKDWLIAQQMMDNNEIFEAEVSGFNNGGLEVVFGKLRGFVPASHISTLPRGVSSEERKTMLSSFVGETIPLKVVEVDRRKRRLILSERAAHRRWQREHRKQLLDEIDVGEVRSGTVRSLANFGAFVDLGGAEGLIHVSEIAWFPVSHPSEVLKVGERVDVKILRIDKQRERIGLSLKRVQPDPWSAVQDDYKLSELVEAVVTRVTDFGAFVRLRTGVEGLLHVSEMADIRPDHPQSLVSPGDLLLLRVIRIEPDRRRIGLSLRQVSETEWAEWAASYRERHAQALEEEAVAEEAEAAEAEAVAEEAEAAEAEAVAEEAEAAEAEAVAEEAEAVEAEAVAEEAEAAEAEVVAEETEAAEAEAVAEEAEAAEAEAVAEEAEAAEAEVVAEETEAAEAQAVAEEAEAAEAEAVAEEAEELESAAAVELVAVEELDEEAAVSEAAATDLEAEAAEEVALAEALLEDAAAKTEVAAELETEAELAAEEADELAVDVESKVVAASALEVEAADSEAEAGASMVADEMDSEAAEDAALAAADEADSIEAEVRDSVAETSG